jgi:hypothetical protein
MAPKRKGKASKRKADSNIDDAPYDSDPEYMPGELPQLESPPQKAARRSAVCAARGAGAASSPKKASSAKKPAKKKKDPQNEKPFVSPLGWSFVPPSLFHKCAGAGALDPAGGPGSRCQLRPRLR